MDNRAEVREFLVSRRAKLTPEQAGLPTYGRRRVPGLRRSEVAALAGVSVEYYSKLERGSLGGASAGVLDAIARALQLDQAERAHLLHLAQAADGTSVLLRPRGRGTKPWSARSSLQWTLDAITNAPAIVAQSPAPPPSTPWRCSRPGRPLRTRLPLSRAHAPTNERRARPERRAPRPTYDFERRVGSSRAAQETKSPQMRAFL